MFVLAMLAGMGCYELLSRWPGGAQRVSQPRERSVAIE
jgi:hypothetical protein